MKDFPEKKDLYNLHRDPKINEMLNKIYEMQEDIQSKLLEAYEKAGLTPAQVKNYLDNPNNFSPEVWQNIQAQRSTLEKKVIVVLGSYVKKEKSIHPGSGVSKERKSKTLGARRNWIPM